MLDRPYSPLLIYKGSLITFSHVKQGRNRGHTEVQVVCKVSLVFRTNLREGSYYQLFS